MAILLDYFGCDSAFKAGGFSGARKGKQGARRRRRKKKRRDEKKTTTTLATGQQKRLSGYDYFVESRELY
ncbi:MAG: hypothetical protein K8F91_03650 [Candidatus Obscuribacterales bacterium]|nr:hypothetical protein [Candidatus Obscuribacterales bacterium]